MTDLSGRHALVSGGGSGVGAAIALALAHSGARVTIVGRTRGTLESITAQHDAVGYVVGDVTDSASVAAVFAQATGDKGPVDIAVANAGTAASKPFTRMDTQDLQTLLDVNLIGVFHVWQAALLSMPAEAGWGRLITISSTAGLRGYPYISAYCAAKHSVIGMTRSLAQEVATKGITVNAICPGYTETPLLERTLQNIVQKTGRSREEAETSLKSLNPQHRFIQPDEIAQTALWLCGTGSESVTGQAISLSGGEV